VRMRVRFLVVAVLAGSACGQGCTRAVVEGEVRAGQGFERVFTPGFKFLLEPIASGWIVRVLREGEARGPHDFAELASPPYLSVTPLAVGTDFSFRAQDAVGWNPRRFRYAGTVADFQKLMALYGPVVAGDARASAELAEVAARQPEVELRILDARLVPGTNDQARMAAMVASHFETTPHGVEEAGAVGTGAAGLGKVTWMRFQVAFELRPGAKVASGVQAEKISCGVETTAARIAASQSGSPVSRKK
jgi:hypothetical protein